jgi:geranylgeranyl pyrophosphate synthase
VVAAKTPPLFGSSLFLGAVLGGAPLSIAAGLEQVGGLVGRLVQVSDDLADAMQQPAGADWRRPGNNLALLYALTSEHAEREALRACLPAVGDAARLEEAQRILLRCGAVSYCAYRLLGLADQARARLEQVRLPDPSPLLSLLDEHLRPLAHLLRQAGVESPESVLTG